MTRRIVVVGVNGITAAAPPAVLAPVAAEPTSVPTVPRAESTVRKPALSDLATQTLARYRARYGL